MSVLAAPGPGTYLLAMLGPLRLALAAALLLAANFPLQAQSRLEIFERDRLVIETEGGAHHDFEVELALTPGQQAQGLMYRRDLAADAGMLFLYARDEPVSMWMKNTLIPLDMLFLARDGRIVHLKERAVPGSLQSISAHEAVAAVLELNGGTVQRLKLGVGDRVLYPALGGGS